MNHVRLGFCRLGSRKTTKNPPSATVASSITTVTARRSSRKCKESRRFLCHSKFSANRSLRPGLIGPKKLRIDLLRPYQVFQLFQARERPVFKDLFRHLNPLE